MPPSYIYGHAQFHPHLNQNTKCAVPGQVYPFSKQFPLFLWAGLYFSDMPATLLQPITAKTRKDQEMSGWKTRVPDSMFERLSRRAGFWSCWALWGVHALDWLGGQRSRFERLWSKPAGGPVAAFKLSRAMQTSRITGCLSSRGQCCKVL